MLNLQRYIYYTKVFLPVKLRLAFIMLLTNILLIYSPNTADYHLTSSELFVEHNTYAYENELIGQVDDPLSTNIQLASFQGFQGIEHSKIQPENIVSFPAGRGPNFILTPPPPIGPKVSQEIRQALDSEERVRVIITLSEPPIPFNHGRGADNSRRAEAIARVQDKVSQRLVNQSFAPGRRLNSLPLMVGTITLDTLMELEANQDIVSVILDDPIRRQGNGVDVLGVTNLHLDGYTGEGVTVAILDSGLSELGYSSLENDVIEQHCFTYGKCAPGGIDESNNALDGDINSHGAIIADIITGTNGYAPDTKIVAVRILNDDGLGYVSDWIAGLEWVSQNKHSLDIDIVNMSLGTTQTFTGACDTAYSSAATIVDRLTAQNVVIVASTGNSGLAGITAPACLSNVIAVGATYMDDLGTMPSTGTYADFGEGWPTCSDAVTSLDIVACFSNMSTETDIVAPGVHTDINDDPILFGTSFSSPAVAGTIALIRQANPLLSPAEIRQVLKNTGTATANSTAKQINPQAAVNSVQVSCDIEIADGDATNFVATIDNANISGTPTIICLAPNGYYDLLGETMSITGNITINGRGATIYNDNWGLYGAIFHMRSISGSLILTDITVITPDEVIRNYEGGDIIINNATFFTAWSAISDNGGVGTIQINNSTFSSTESGAGWCVIYTTGATTITNSYFLNNSGCAISADAPLTVSDSTFENNHKSAIINSAESTITNSYFYGNNASEQGGAISNTGILTISDSIFSGNQTSANNGGGAIYNTGTITLTNNSFASNKTRNFGGSISNIGGNVIITNSNFSQDIAFRGASLFNYQGTVTIDTSTFDNNFSNEGASGILVNEPGSVMEVTNSTFSGNMGVAIENHNLLTVTNATFFQNIPIRTSGTLSGIMYETGAIRNEAGTATINNSSMIDNGLIGIYTKAGSIIQIKNSIITSTNINASNCDGSGTISTAGINFSNDGSCLGFTQITTEVLELGVLEDNGGGVETVSLANGSVAVDAIPVEECTDFTDTTTISTDQRGTIRPIGGACDAGAFEYIVEVPTDDFANAPTIEQVQSYGYSGDAAGTHEIGEPTNCIEAGLIEIAKSQHINFTGRGRAYSWVSGRGRAYSWRSGDLIYKIDTTGSNYDTAIGIYLGDTLQTLVPVDCDNTLGTPANLIVRIPAETVESLEEYHIIIWNQDNIGTELTLTIEPAAFDSCSDVSEIPERECEALVTFFNNTDGENWINSDGWLTIIEPCSSWYGVVCVDGHITDLDLAANNVINIPQGMTFFKYFQNLIYNPVTTDIVVNTTKMMVDDDGDCSLIEAIIAANTDTASGALPGECVAGNGSDTIQLGNEKTYLLDSIFTYDTISGIPTLAGTGLPEISSNIIIEGNGSNVSRSDINSTPMFRIFSVSNPSNVTLKNLIIQNGVAGSGGGINIGGGSVTILNSTIKDNVAVLDGGGINIVSGATLALLNSVVSNNQSGRDGGGIKTMTNTAVTISDSTIANNKSGNGGGIYSSSLVIRNSTISENTADISGGGLNSSGSVFIVNSTISANIAGQGGGIKTADTITISSSTISHNSANTFGGAIVFDDVSTVTITDTIISNNTASSDNGGAIYGYDSPSSTLEIINSQISNNNSSLRGGGIYSDATIIIENSTINNNSTGTTLYCYGGGIFFTGSAEITNSTITGNISFIGGGIYNNGGTGTIIDSTLSRNIALSGGGVTNNGIITIQNSSISNNITDGTGSGINNSNIVNIISSTITENTNEGIYNSGTLTISHSIVANNNIASNGTDISGTVNSQDYNLIQNTSSATITGTTINDIYGVDPLLNPLANNGGPTQTHSLQLNSPAINAGGVCSLATDQRGAPRDTNCDIGSYEDAALSVTLDDACDANGLINAINGAMNTPTHDTINLGADCVYTLEASNNELNGNNGLPVITDVIYSGTLTINGNGATIIRDNTAPQFRILQVTSGGNVELKDITISGGDATDYGGGIFNWGIVQLSNSNIIENSAEWGGGIYNIGSSLDIVDSTLSSNTATFGGGGVLNSGALTITNSTVSTNNTHTGGGIYNNSGGTGTIDHSTIFNNTGVHSGGIFNIGTINIAYNIIAGNTAGAPDIYGTVNSQDYNIIQDTTGVTLTGITTNNIYGIDPLLNPLANDGGSTKTHSLQSNSPAINASGACGLVTDQRSYLRDDNCDIGSYEYVPTIIVNTCNTDDLITAVNQANNDPVNNTIELNGACPYTLTAINNSIDGHNGIPKMPDANNSGVLIVNGNGATIIRDNTAPNFRIMHIDSGAVVTINDLTLRGGDAGTAIDGTGDGGAIWNDGVLILDNVTLTDNHGVWGGAIRNNSSLQIENSTISNNTGVYGGAIDTGGLLIIRDSVVDGNIATTTAGAIHVQSTSSTYITRVTFTNNVGNAHGGAIKNLGTTSITQSIFLNNTAVDGGAINNMLGTVEISDSTFDSNIAGSRGGAIMNHDTTTLTINNSSFTSNQATSGSGISNYGTVTISSGSQFNGHNGTAIINSTNDFEYTGEMTISSTTIENNGGDGIGNYRGTLQLSDSLIANNQGTGVYGIEASTNISNTTIHNNNGGGVSASRGGVTLTGSTVSQNTSESGGGVYGRLGYITIIDSEIIGNIAEVSGGGVYSGVDSTLSITNTMIANNTAQEYGGGLYNSDSSISSNVTDSTLSQNHADIIGGGVYHRFGYLTLTNTEITNNTVGQYGGGLAGCYGATTVSGGSIINNSALLGGGGLYICESASTNIDGTAVTDNQTQGIGSAILVDDSNNPTVAIVNSCIVANDGLAISNISTNMLEATNNWWGLPNGPTIPNGYHYGDSVSTLVNTSSFLTSPILGCATLPNADLVVSGDDNPDPVIAGRNVQYNITVVNNGPDMAHNVVITHTLPENATFVDVTHSGCVHNNGILVCQIGDMLNNNQQTLSITVNTNLDNSNTITSAFDVISDEPDVSIGNNIVNVETIVTPLISAFITEQELQVGLQAQIAAHPEGTINFILVDLLPNGIDFTVRLTDETVGEVFVSVVQDTYGQVTIQVTEITIDGIAAPASFVDSINRELMPLLVSSLDTIIQQKVGVNNDLEYMSVTDNQINASFVSPSP